MMARLAHTVHLLIVHAPLGEAISRRLPEVKVVNVRTHGYGKSDIYSNLARKLTDEELAPLQEAEILVCDTPLLSQVLSRKGLNFMAKLRWAENTFAGVCDVMQVVKQGVEPPFVLTRSSGDATAHMMAEYVVGRIVCSERGWMDTHLKQVSKDCKGWHALRDFRALSELTVGVLGLGHMGLGTALALKGFGCRVHGFARTSRSRPDAESCVDQLWHGQEGLADLLKHCDYLVNLLPSTPHTHGLLGGEVLSGASRSPVLVNVGRGDIISEADLLEALERGWLSGAVLDCFETEPVPEESRLWTHPRVAMTPHNSCFGNVDYKCQAVAEDFSANFANFLAGRPLKGQVDWKAGY